MYRYALLSLLALLLVAPLAAQPYMYWTNRSLNTISRSNIDGTSANTSFITGVSTPFGITTNDTYVYWTNYGNGTIGRANLDGTGVNQSFIAAPNGPFDITVSSTHVYWANYGNGTIGRANLDGTGVNQSFITGASGVTGITSDGTYLYWTNTSNNTIGRANLDGTGVNHSFIAVSSSTTGIAVNGTHVYWSSFGSNTIGRANLDGSSPNNALISGGSGSRGVTLDDTYVYWSNMSNSTFGRANLDGSNVNQSFITGTGSSFNLSTTQDGTLPVELTSFTATLDGSGALLRWETASETNNSGFDVEHRTGTDAFRSVGFAPGRGTTLETSRYSHAVTGLTPGTHVFRLRQVDFDGAFDYSAEVELTLEADGLALALYGNPATDAIRGSLSVPSAQTATVALYDALGRQVVAQQDVQGAFTMDVSALASGSYVLRVTAGTQAITKNVVVAR